ncbi:MAG TPA: HlyD family efflux transporter periplasmic adaptor subunit [Thermoguttaceae bacterium]|nr:HlyD family efflux transporter periplasmic adaptor subunit [Thermoguttaceae bacterium]
MRCLVSLIQEVAVPAREPGVLKALIVKEGDLVMPDQLLAQIDDTRAQMQLTAAKLKLQVARKQAENTTNVEYARAASDVAKAEWIQADDANKKVPGAVTTAEMRRLALTFHRTEWEIKQAQEDLVIAGLQADVSQAELDAAADNLQRRKILSPLEGEVVKVHRHEGEWVTAGDPVLDIVLVNQLWVEGFLSATDYTPGEIKGRPVSVKVKLAHGRAEQFSGTITFVSPLVELGGKRLVRATVENRKENGEWLLSAGLTAEMTINGITAQ